jgi:Tfp pilus assembly protein PilF
LLGNCGNLYLRQGDLRRATADFDAAIRLDKGYSRAWGLRAQVRLRTEDWANALDDLNQAEKLTPGHYETLSLRGIAHHGAGNAAAARKDWSAVVKDRPDHVRGMFCRGAMALMDGKMTDAVEGLAQALTDPVLAPYAAFLLARAWVEIPGPGRERAVKYAEELVRLRPKEWAAYVEAARIHARAADRAEADAGALRDRAIGLLGEAVKLDSEIRAKLATDPAFESLRKDARFPK